MHSIFRTHPTEASLRHLLTQSLGVDATNIEPDRELTEALGIDSLSSLEVMASVETEFGVFFPPEHLSRPRTLSKILESIEEVSREAP
ncbi:MAG: acyl carrier protein [Magnetococcales bacterium]|nr:acyl carrier protein [Magnetococcales bacterium]